MGSVSSISRALHHAAFRAGLVGDQRHAEDLARRCPRLRSAFLRDFDAAAFAASAGVNLRFHDDAAAEFLRRRFGFVDGERHFAARHGDVVFGQNGLGLILVNFHGLCTC